MRNLPAIRRPKLRVRALLLPLALLALCGCDAARITGHVVDVKGDPLPGVAVEVAETDTQVLTNALGAYRLAYPPGDLTLRFMKTGYTPGLLELTPEHVAQLEATPMQLWRLPTEPGLYFFRDYRYVPVDRAEPDRFVTRGLGILYGTKRKADKAQAEPEPMLIGYHVPPDGVLMERLVERELTLDGGKQELTVQAWIPINSVAVSQAPIDEPARMLSRIQVAGPLPPGRYAVHWGALKGKTSLDRRMFLFTVPEPEPELADEPALEAGAAATDPAANR